MSGLLGAFHSASGSIRSGFNDDTAHTVRKFKKENMLYQFSYPEGCINAIDLPADIYADLMRHVSADGTLDASIGPVYGNYVNFGTYRIKVTIYEVTPTTYKVRLV